VRSLEALIDGDGRSPWTSGTGGVEQGTGLPFAQNVRLADA